MHNTVLPRPVVLSYFAQSGSEEKDYLKSLEGEYKSIDKAWEQGRIQAGSDRHITVDFPSRFSADGNEVAEDIRNYKNRIILFHFSGHATSKTLLFKDGASHARGIAGLLGEVPNLKLVVLNGCATNNQVSLLFENKVKIVIATRWKVSDEAARKFADTFHKALSNRYYSIRNAFQHALNELQRQHSSLESITTKPIIWRGLDTESEDDLDRWELYVGEEWEGLLDDPDWWRIGDLPSSPSKPHPKTLYSDGQAAVPEHFKGREEELTAIHEKLNAGGRIIILRGEGGLGKTTLAAKYVEENANHYDNKAWVFCKGGIVEDLKNLVSDPTYFQDCVTEEQVVQRLRMALLEMPESTLLVLDNINNPDDIQYFRQHFQDLRWHVLMTSRYGAELEGEFLVKHLPEKAAKELFREFYIEGTPDFETLLGRVLTAIGYNTLLIEVFAKNLRKAHAIRRETMASFLEKLETKGLLLNKDSFTIATDYLSNVHKAQPGHTATTDQILEVLYDFASLAESERYWLVNMALLPAQNYEAYFLEELWGTPDESICETYLEPLAQKGWLTSENYTYRLSPVIQALVLEKNKETRWEDAKNLVARFVKLLKLEKDKDNIFTKFKWVPLSLPVLNHLYEIKKPLFSNFLNCLATVVQEFGGENNLLSAKELLEKTLANDVDNFGEHSHIVAESQSNLATCLQYLGDEKNLERARELLEQSLATGIELFGTQSNVVTLRQSKLATILLNLGGPDNLMLAQELSESALANDLDNFGKDAPTLAVRRFNLAKVLLSLGGVDNLNRARDLLEKSITSNTANFGKHAPTVAAGQTTLALVLRDIKDIGDIDGKTNLIYASRLLEKAIESTIINFGSHSPRLITPTWNLFNVCLDLKLLQEAADHLLFIYPISEKSLPETHPLKALIREAYRQIKKAGF